jgi:hypothetical protein
LWGAGAYKGADGPNADLPKLSTRVTNMQGWVKATKRYGLKGVVATGWSRYNTYMTPCESMEASWDAMVMAGAILWDGPAAPAGPELEAEAQAMLRTGALRKLAGERFWECREAAGELAAGWAETMRLVDQARQFPHLAGVKDRYSPAAWEGFKENWKRNGKRLTRGARLWKQAHAGRVPMVWVAEYLRSRTWLPDLLQAGLG